ncbi:tripartite motif-containing protein 16 [Boleophthalmus pectinirostris]|uniref:tripartite motif-containing protein 16 n=1 Tax=Boleophthalmus pectinirostris TaxID=150288 RepID=UPI0024303DD7|nr:tripartite motif-containing protein 16 [Boleophthalmus pectinirostris]
MVYNVVAMVFIVVAMVYYVVAMVYYVVAMEYNVVAMVYNMVAMVTVMEFLRKNSVSEFQPPPYDASLPEPATRDDFIKHWLPVTLDDRTAQKLLWISEGGAKVARTSEAVCPYPTRPERYDHSPQVLCKEAVWGFRGYWEVDFDGWVVLGVVGERAPRKVQDGPCGLGENSSSWGVGWAGSSYQVWHNAENTDVTLPLSGTMGVYVDQPAGVIKFLLVEGPEGGAREVRLISKFKVEVQEKLLPGFWVGTNSWCVLRKKDA